MTKDVTGNVKESITENVDNKVMFLYKPAYFGESKLEKELDFYASERQEDLRRAGLVDIYEEFWNSRTVIKTNIYGAIPCEVLSDEQGSSLMRFGWRPAEVDLAIVKDGEIPDEQQLKGEDGKFIVLKERKDDKSLLLMRFRFQSLFELSF